MMKLNNLLEQWNDHIIKGNQLSRELEDIEDLLSRAREADICFSSGNNGAIFIRVLGQEKMQELKESAMIAIMRTRDEKETELQKLMGKQPVIPAFGQEIVVHEKRKPATINPEFEAAVKEMVTSGKKKEHPDPKDEVVIPKKIAEKKPELNVADVKRMYHDEAKTMKEIAEYFGVKKEQVNSFIQKNNLQRTSYKKDDIFLDSKVQARQSKTK